MQILEQIFSFSKAVVSQYKFIALVGGFLALNIFEHISKRRGKPMKIPTWLSRAGMAVGILAACFFAWNDENTARKAAEADNRYKQERIDKLSDSISKSTAFEVKSAPASKADQTGRNDNRAWPALTDAQSKELMTTLAPYKPHTWFVLYGNRHAYAFSDSLFSVGSSLGCEGRIEQRPEQAKFGIVVWMHKDEPARDALSLFLRKNGYPFSIDDTKANTPGVFFFLIGDKTVGF